MQAELIGSWNIVVNNTHCIPWESETLHGRKNRLFERLGVKGEV